jgi:organic radical activating enzyme
MVSYKIVEIFNGLQGEGPDVGKQAVFIRFSGCNLNCSFCDTDQRDDVRYDVSLDELLGLVKECNANNANLVVLTGGEPTLVEDLDVLIDSLSGPDCSVAIETNGTTKYYNSDAKIVVSPKADYDDIISYYNMFDNCYLKFLFGGIDDLNLIDNLLTENNYSGRNVYYQPIISDDGLSSKALVNIFSGYNFKGNYTPILSTQIHKIYNLR